MTQEMRLPTPPRELGRAVRAYGAECWAAGATAARQEQAGLLRLLANIRAAVGDADGRLMQDELVERVRELAGPRDPDMDTAARDTAQRMLPKPRKMRGTAYDVNGDVAIYTEGDALEYGRRLYRAGRQDGRLDDREALRRADAQKIHEDERQWADWRNGTGPKPGGGR